jgi:ABC-type dipeptide/oligopeptide/nickel transport system permease subunit
MWLLVQAGHGEVGRYPAADRSAGALARDVGVRLLTTLLKLAGVMLALAMVTEQAFNLPGAARFLLQVVMRRDFPVIVGILWVFALTVIVARLAGDVIGIAFDHYVAGRNQPENPNTQETRRRTIPKAWLYVSLGLVAASILVAAIGPALTPYGANEVSLDARGLPPGEGHLLGTDMLGRDVFTRVLAGIQTDLRVSGIAVGALSLVAVGWAMLAAFVRKRDNWVGDTLEDLVMLPRDILTAFPWLAMLLVLISLVGPGVYQMAFIGSLVLLPRAVALMREASGSPPADRSWLQAVLLSIPVMLLLATAGGFVYTSTISYLGVGVPPPVPELGGILAGEGRRYLAESPWLARWPGIVLGLLTLVWVMAGDTLLERVGFRTKAVWSKVFE